MEPGDSASNPLAQERDSYGRELRILKPGEVFGNYRVIRCLSDGLRCICMRVVNG